VDLKEIERQVKEWCAKSSLKFIKLVSPKNWLLRTHGQWTRSFVI
jgi:hypothetical protein